MSTALGKVLVITGLAIAGIGGIIWLLAKSGFRGLPGDIHVQREGVSFSFPIVTCIVISIVLTILANLFFRR